MYIIGEEGGKEEVKDGEMKGQRTGCCPCIMYIIGEEGGKEEVKDGEMKGQRTGCCPCIMYITRWTCANCTTATSIAWRTF